tara:strand:- start:453 stop:662 length:210 start_codon:yes stop_codon:yes gene_type:complete
MTMTENVETTKPTRRLRATESGLRKALLAARAAGFTVERLNVLGGEYEIHFAGVAHDAPSPDDEDLEQW